MTASRSHFEGVSFAYAINLNYNVSRDIFDYMFLKLNYYTFINYQSAGVICSYEEISLINISEPSVAP